MCAFLLCRYLKTGVTIQLRGGGILEPVRSQEEQIRCFSSWSWPAWRGPWRFTFPSVFISAFLFSVGCVRSFTLTAHTCLPRFHPCRGASDQATGVLSELTSLMLSSSVDLAFVAGGVERMQADGVVTEYVAETLKSLHNHQERWRIVLRVLGGITGMRGR